MRPTLIEELMAAGRGTLGLLIGDRTAPGYFSFTTRGLAGSFIVVLLITVVSAYLPLMLGVEVRPGSITRGILIAAILLALQIAFSAIVLRQLNRLDGLLPYLVADNWVRFFLTLISAALAAAGVVGTGVVIVLGLVIIVTEVNIARLVVTLSPLQIGMLIIAQFVGVAIGLALIGLVFPLPADVLAQLTAP
jgi:hypothetical protein